MRYVEARIIENTREETYRIYITDTLYMYGQNMRPTKRWADLAYPDVTEQREPEKTADEIAQSVIQKAGLKLR